METSPKPQPIPCRYFTQGKCKFGSECMYMHDRGGRVPTLGYPADQSPTKDTISSVNMQYSLTSEVVSMFQDDPNQQELESAPAPKRARRQSSGSNSSSSSSSVTSAIVAGVASIPTGHAMPSFKALDQLRMIEVRRIGKIVNMLKENGGVYSAEREPLAPKTPRASLSVSTWNVLSDNYVHHGYYPQCPTWALEWKHRRAQMLKSVSQLDTDILCLQEMDNYSLFWDPEMTKLGYESKHFRRPGREDGCGIFWKKSKFEFVKEEKVHFDELVNWPFDSNMERYRKNCGAIFVELKHIETNEHICVATTHIFWNPRDEDVKIRQVMLLLHRLEKFWPKKNQLLLCGDFNSTPSSVIYSLLREGFADLREWDPADISGRLSFAGSRRDVRKAPCDLSSFYLDEIPDDSRRTKALLNLDEESRRLFVRMTSPELHHQIRPLQSAYQFYNVYETSPSTNNETSTAHNPESDRISELSLRKYITEARAGRGEPITSHFSKFTGTLDYIFLSNDWTVRKYLQLPGRSALFSMRGLPTPDWPSDHLLLSAEIALV